MTAASASDVWPSPGVNVASGSRPALLSVRDLRLSFRTEHGPVRAVDGVSFTVAPGETMGLVGESGSGKTALSRAVMGLISPKRAARSGEVLFNGRDLGTLREKDMRDVLGSEVAMVFQDPMTSLNPVMRIGEQLAEGPRLHRGLSKADARSRALELLRAVHIPEATAILRRYPHQLSGGMRQRVVIAIALACGPQLLIADEPTTALDVTVQAEILDLLKEMQRERGMAIVLVTHDLGVVASRTDHIAVMYAGKIVEYGPTRALFREARMPYTEALLRAIPRIDSKERQRLQAMPGRSPSLVNPPAGCRFAPRCRYAQDRCHSEEPQLQDAPTPGHRFACFYPAGTPEGAEALALNERAGRTSPVHGSPKQGGR
jgi:peptide/nickel transport system ATP-binding protein